MLRKTVLICFITILFLPGMRLLYAAELVDEQAKISIWYPDNWRMQNDDDSVIVSDPDGDVVFFYKILDTDDLKKAVAEMHKELGDLVDNPRTADNPIEDKLNGMDRVFIDAGATVQKVPVALGIMLVFTPGKKILIVISMTPRSKSAEYEKIINRLITGVKPMK